MPIGIFDLDGDSLYVICGFLTISDLRAMSNSSWIGFHKIAPSLVRKVDLARDMQQIRDFCHFVTKYDLCSYIVSLTLPSPIRRGNQYGVDGPLADVLECATSLVHLSLKIEREDHWRNDHNFRIEKALCRRPPTRSFGLSGHITSSLESLITMPGVPHLTLWAYSPAEYYSTQEQAIEAIIRNSADILETLELGNALPISLRSEDPRAFSCIRLRNLKMLGTSVLPSQVALMFPNLQFLDVIEEPGQEVLKRGEMVEINYSPLSHYDCPPRTIFPSLLSFSGPDKLAFNLSQHHSPRRIRLTYEIKTRNSDIALLPKTLSNLDIRSLAVRLYMFETLETTSRLLSHVLPSMIQSARHLSYFCVSSLNFVDDTCCVIPRLVRLFWSTLPFRVNFTAHDNVRFAEQVQVAPLFSPLEDLKYLKLGIQCRSPRRGSWRHVDTAITTDDIIRAFMTHISSLRYLELDVEHGGLGHNFWRRIEHSDETSYQQVSEEEGSSTRDWYDMEEWRRDII